MRHYHHHHHQARQELTIFSSSSIPALECSLNKGRERERESFLPTLSLLLYYIYVAFSGTFYLPAFSASLSFLCLFFPLFVFSFYRSTYLSACLPGNLYCWGGSFSPPSVKTLYRAQPHHTHITPYATTLHPRQARRFTIHHHHHVVMTIFSCFWGG